MTTETVDPLRQERAKFSETFLKVEKDVLLRAWTWIPEGKEEESPLIFLPGWVSVIAGWRDFLAAVVTNRPVVYIETKEKHSARIGHPVSEEDYGIERMADNLIKAFEALPFSVENAVISGSSYGATIALEAMKHGNVSPKGAFFVGVNTEFAAPWAFRLLVQFPAWVYHPSKYFVLWYLRHFMVNTEKEPEQMQRYEETLLKAIPARVKYSVKAAFPYSVWQDIETVSAPVGVAFSDSDTLHTPENIERLLQTLPQGIEVRCPTNKYMHSAALAEDFETFAKKL